MKHFPLFVLALVLALFVPSIVEARDCRGSFRQGFRPAFRHDVRQQFFHGHRHDRVIVAPVFVSPAVVVQPVQAFVPVQLAPVIVSPPAVLAPAPAGAFVMPR